MLAFDRFDFGAVAVFAGEVGGEEGEAAAEDQQDDERAAHHPAGREGDALTDSRPESVGGVGGVLELVPAHLIGGEDRPVERADDQRGDPFAAEPPQDPVDQHQGQQDEHQQAGEDDAGEGAHCAAFDDPPPRALGDLIGARRGALRVGHEGPEGAATEDRQQRRQQGQHREGRAGDADRCNWAEAGGAVDLGDGQAEQRRDHGGRGGEDRRPGGGERSAHRLVLVDRAVQLLAVAGDKQQGVVGSGAEDQHRHDRARLAVDRHAQLRDPVADRARERLGKYHRRQRNEEEHRRAVDDDQQEDHQAERGQQQRAVDAFEDFDCVGREAGPAGDLHLEAAARVGDFVAPELDRVDDQISLAFGFEICADDRRFAVGRADWADEGGVAGGLTRDRRGRSCAAGREAFRRRS